MRSPLLWILFMLPTAIAGEVVFRADFEQAEPAGWRFLNQRGECSGAWDPAEPPGAGGGSLRCEVPKDLSARATWVAPRIELKPSTAYRLRFRTMLGDISEGARGAYAILYENGQQSPDFWHLTDYLQGSQDWHERELRFTTRPDCTWGELQLKLWECTGYVWFDEVTLESLDDAVPVLPTDPARLVLPDDDGFPLQTIWYPAHRRADRTLHLLQGRLNPVALFPWGDAKQLREPALIIEAPASVTVAGPVVAGRELPPEPVEVGPEPMEQDGLPYLRWRLPIRADTLVKGLRTEGPNWTGYHFVYAEPGAGSPTDFRWYWRFENGGEVGPRHSLAARTHPNLGPNLAPVDGFELYAQHSSALRLPTATGRARVLDWLHYGGIRGGLALSYYQPELLPIDRDLAEQGWFTWTWRWYGYGGPVSDGQAIVYDRDDARQRSLTCPQVQVELLEPHASYLREFYAEALALDRDWLILNYEPPVFNVCFCDRCRRSFAERSGRGADEVLALTPQQIQALPEHAWGRFRAWQNERIIKNHAAMIRELDPACRFGVCGPPWTDWTAERGMDIARFEPEVGLHAPMIYQPPERFEPLLRTTCENTAAPVMPFLLGSDIAVPGVQPDAWDQWANLLATALSGGDGAILWVGIESLDGEMIGVLRRSMEQIRRLRPFLDGAERGAGVRVEPEVGERRIVRVGARDLEVGAENSRVSVRDWQWRGAKGKLVALLNYDRAARHTVRLTAPGIANGAALLGPPPEADGEALRIDLGPGELAVVTWR